MLCIYIRPPITGRCFRTTFIGCGMIGSQSLSVHTEFPDARLCKILGYLANKCASHNTDRHRGCMWAAICTDHVWHGERRSNASRHLGIIHKSCVPIRTTPKHLALIDLSFSRYCSAVISTNFSFVNLLPIA
jgi:hypothetical protein